jgi:2'-5' RNA ligase
VWANSLAEQSDNTLNEAHKRTSPSASAFHVYTFSRWFAACATTAFPSFPLELQKTSCFGPRRRTQHTCARCTTFSFARFVHVMAERSHRVIANGGSKARPYTKHIELQRLARPIRHSRTTTEVLDRGIKQF